jgi:hypothetical protein
MRENISDSEAMYAIHPITMRLAVLVGYGNHSSDSWTLPGLLIPTPERAAPSESKESLRSVQVVSLVKL